MSKLEGQFSILLAVFGIDDYEREYKFHKTRKWRFDFAWPEQKIAVEIEGGTYIRGRHQRPKGYSGDCEKYNAAVCGGWRVFRFASDMVNNGKATEFIENKLLDLLNE